MQKSLSDRYSYQGHLKRSGQRSRETAQQLGRTCSFQEPLEARTSASCGGQLATSSLAQANLAYHLLVVVPTFPSLKAKDSDVLLPILLLFGASSQEAGVTHSS